MDMLRSVLGWVVARGREPSTYAGLAALLVYMHVPDAQSWAKDFTGFAVGACSLLAMFMQEKGI